MQDILNFLQTKEPDMRSWRRHLHSHPEVAYKEYHTAEFVYERLREFGFAASQIRTGFAGTGIVASIEAENPDAPVFALRADMDALLIEEKTNLPYASKQPGIMHACGHDGHMAMLLGAASYLQGEGRKKLKRHIRLIFQPAEENEGGAKRMLEDGLLDKLPFDRIYGLHNFPGYPEGVFALREGAVMASYDIFDIKITGKGGHAAMPARALNPISIAAQLIPKLEGILPETGLSEMAVLSVTQLDSGTAYNIIPDTAVIRGTVRSLSLEAQDQIESKIKECTKQMAGHFSKSGEFAKIEVHYERRYPLTINHKTAVEHARSTTTGLFGKDALDTDGPVSMGSEDFSFFANQVPACYARLGAGAIGQGQSLHNSAYDFNDRLLVRGAAWWCGLALF